MANSSNQCPRCKNYILGEYCYTCKEDIRNMTENIFTGTPLEDIFKKGDNND